MIRNLKIWVLGIFLECKRNKNISLGFFTKQNEFLLHVSWIVSLARQRMVLIPVLFTYRCRVPASVSSKSWLPTTNVICRINIIAWWQFDISDWVGGWNFELKTPLYKGRLRKLWIISGVLEFARGRRNATCAISPPSLQVIIVISWSHRVKLHIKEYYPIVVGFFNWCWWFRNPPLLFFVNSSLQVSIHHRWCQIFEPSTVLVW